MKYFLLFAAVLQAQLPVPPATPSNAAIKEAYSKFEYRISARDGVKLFVAVYVPKDVFSAGKTYPVMMTRTPYSVGPYGQDQYPFRLGPSELFSKDKFIFVYGDVRGRYLSEGEPSQLRPHKAVKSSAKDTDESTDTYDTIDWIVKHVPGCEPKVGLWGISQPGFYASAGMIDAHPALLAVSPQAPVTDYYLGDDVYHNGAFMLAANFGFYMNFRPRVGEPGPPTPALRFEMGTPDGYDFFLSMGPLANSEEKYFKRSNPFWTELLENSVYNKFWEAHSIWKHLKAIKPSVMTVGGWFDAEDLQGPLRTFEAIETHSPPATNMLVMGPWTHGGFSRGDGDKVGNIGFNSKTGVFYRENIEFPFFLSKLKGKGEGKFPKAWVFETGVNQWRRFDAWPPKATATAFYPDANGLLAMAAGKAGVDEYVSDPNRPVPYLGGITPGMKGDYMTEDQRFASSRGDVLVYKTPVLTDDVSVFGPIGVDLKISTTGTDSDFVVKLIDVYPGDYPDGLGGYQQLVRGEPFRGKYRKGFDAPIPFVPGKEDAVRFQMPDVAHTFRAGHRIMVQIQSSWFPLIDRNPQRFLEIPKALTTDFVKATERVYRGPGATKLTLPIQ